MTILAILGFIYGIGVQFYAFLGIFTAINIWAKESTHKNLINIPLFFVIGFVLGLLWPVILFKDSEFREQVVECGRLFIPLGYLFCVIMTFIYPWIWAWYLAGVACWVCLDRYHYKWSVQPRK
jgi:uncharacterized membrane protein